MSPLYACLPTHAYTMGYYYIQWSGLYKTLETDLGTKWAAFRLTIISIIIIIRFDF